MIYLELFWSFFQIGLFSIGGGYASMPLIQNQIVDIKHWLTLGEFADVITISQMTPGPIGVNSATFVGIQVAGTFGAIAATLGCILPSCIIVLTLAYIYYKFKNLSILQGILNGLRPAVVAMIASAGLTLTILAVWNGQAISGKLNTIDLLSIVIFLVSIIVLRKYKVNPIYVMIASGIVGLCIYPFYI